MVECWFADICQPDNQDQYCHFEAVIPGAKPCEECETIPECPGPR